MQEKAKELFEFVPDKLRKVAISEVRENDWNPKNPNSPEYEKVKRSIEINGLTQPIFVRENDNGETKYEVLDGAHRFRSCKELGFKEIYIYNEGKVPDPLAKSFTIYHQIQVPFDEAELAPIVMELNDLKIELPYNELEIDGFRNLATFNFDDAWKDQTPIKEDNEKDEEILTIKMTSAQLEVVNNAIEEIKATEKIKEGEALAMLCERGLGVIYPSES